MTFHGLLKAIQQFWRTKSLWKNPDLSPPVKYFTDRSKAVLLLWIFYVFVLSCVCYVLCASVYMCFVVTCWERADLLALVCGVFCEFVTFPLVSWVRCGTWLYRFLIFATLLTLSVKIRIQEWDNGEISTKNSQKIVVPLFAAPNKGTTILYWFRSLSSVKS